MMTPDLIAELAEVMRLSEAATPGPWHRHTDCPGMCCWHMFTSPDGIYGSEPVDAEASLINSPEMSDGDAAYIVALSNFIRTHHAEIEANERDAGVSLGPELLRFSSFQDWVNHAQSRFANARVASSDYICIDATGRICRIGKHFMSARDRGAFPVIVYHIDPGLDAAMRDSAREDRE